MGRPKGLQKTGGRQKGVPNKRSDELLEIIRKQSYNPIEAILDKYKELSSWDQLKIDLKLLEYVYPKFREAADVQCTQNNASISDLTDEQIIQRKLLYKSILTD